MAMTRKHFEDVADIISSVYDKYKDVPLDSQAWLMMSALMIRLELMFSLDNPRFDQQRFRRACGIPENCPPTDR